MVHTKLSQRHARDALDEKLALQAPSREILEELAVECAANPRYFTTVLCFMIYIFKNKCIVLFDMILNRMLLLLLLLFVLFLLFFS